MSDIQPASFADLKKAWDYWRHHQDLTNGVTPNARAHRLEFLRGMHQIKTQAKAEALRDFADAHRMPWTIFLDKDENPVTVSDLIRETANNYLGKETRND